MLRYLIALLPVLAIGCTPTAEPVPERTVDEPDTAMPYLPLQQTLDAKKAAFEAHATDEKKRIYAEGIEAVQNSGVLSAAKQVGDTAVNFILRNANGTAVELDQLLLKGPVVLTWYRGGWCPYCNLTLHRLQEELPKFKAAGATLVALSPELPDSSLSTSDRHALQFEVLSDPGNAVARSYGVVHKLTAPVAESYQASFDLHAYDGDTSDELPLPATYVIGTDKVITYAFLNADYRNRAEPRDILKALQRMNTLKE